tara:strand:- start:658 stop:858 length:201 start_codon:yes stop_codon:yes gene_type:complete
MKIYLTEVEDNGKIYAGPNILALNWEEAEKAAKYNNLILVGEFVEIVTEGGVMHYVEEKETVEVLH